MAEAPGATNGTQAHGPSMVTTAHALQVYTDLMRRVTLTRAGVTFSGRRDLYETLGYQRDLRYLDYKERYGRDGLAARIIDAFPQATWREPPTIRETGKPDETVETPFEQAWQSLVTRLGLWQAFMRVDKLASLGHYAILVLGLRGQVAWQDEATPVRGPDDLLYVNAYSEEHAKLMELVFLDTSPRFGQPAYYNVDFSRRLTLSGLFDPTLLPSLGGIYGATMRVHASRLIHVAENGLEDNIIGTPRLRAIWNYLDDLDKVLGGSAEMFWQDAKRRIVLSLDPMAKLQDESKLTEEVEEFVHEMRNFLRVQGMEVTQLEGRIPDPGSHVDKLLDVIAGTVRIPKRLLIGSERGELASTHDENNWVVGIMERQALYAEPRILRQFIDLCIALRILPTPAKGYTVEWPNLLALTEKERADIALTWTRTIATYAAPLGTPEDVIPLEIFLEGIMGFSKDQVARIMELLSAPTTQDMGETTTGGTANAA